MHYSKLKNKYPKIWEDVEHDFLSILNAGSQWQKLSNEEKEALAHNAAFQACYSLHKESKGELNEA